MPAVELMNARWGRCVHHSIRQRRAAHDSRHRPDLFASSSSWTPPLHRAAHLRRTAERPSYDVGGGLCGGFCIPADEEVGRGDAFIAREVASLGTPVVGILTKIDRLGRDALASQLVAVSKLLDFAEIVPVSAVRDEQVDVLVDLLVGLLPAGPALYPEGELTDEPEQVLVAELIREAALEGVREELPHSLAVTVEEMVPRSDRDLTDVHANIYVERPSQKAIVIGSGGSRLREVGTTARQHIEALLGTPVFLDLRVKVAKDWQRDPKQLRRLGF